MTEELIKANDIIHKLQTDIRMLNQKVIIGGICFTFECFFIIAFFSQLKTRTDVATEQEKILQQREAELTKMRASLENTTKMQEEFTQLKAKNEEKDVTIKSNEQSISFCDCIFLTGY